MGRGRDIFAILWAASKQIHVAVQELRGLLESYTGRGPPTPEEWADLVRVAVEIERAVEKLERTLSVEPQVLN